MKQMLLALLLLLPQSVKWNPYADVIFTNGKIVTVDTNFTIAQALAIKDGKLIAGCGGFTAAATVVLRWLSVRPIMRGRNERLIRCLWQICSTSCKTTGVSRSISPATTTLLVTIP